MMTGQKKDFIKAFLQFQSFVLNESQLIPYDAIQKSLATEKDIKKAATIITAVVMSGLAEDYIQTGMAQIFSTEDYAKEEREKGIWTKFFESSINKVPGLNNIYGMFKYDSSGFPTYDVAMDIREGAQSLITGKQTETKQKGAVKIGQSVGTLFGVAGSSQAGQILKKEIGEPKKKKKKRSF